MLVNINEFPMSSEQSLKAIEERERELEELEKSALFFKEKKIPERKFGFGITKANQEQVLKQREEATEILEKISKEKETLKEIKGEIIRRQEIQSRSEKRQRDIEIGKKTAAKVVFEGQSAALSRMLTNRTQRKAYEAYYDIYKSRKKRAEQQEKLQQQGLTPIYDTSGQLVGFRDEIRQQTIPLQSITSLDIKSLERYEKAGVVIRSKSPTLKEQILQMSLPETERYKLFSEQEIDSRKYNGNINLLLAQRIAPRDNVLSGEFTRSRNENVLKFYVLTSPFYPRGVSAFSNSQEGLKKIESFLMEQRQKRGIRAVGAGFGNYFLGPIFTLNTILSQPPQKTIKDFGQGIGEFGIKVFVLTYSKKELREEIFKTTAKITREPEYSLGKAGAAAFTFFLPKIVVKSVDMTRTARLTRVPEKLIIAPEFYKGQTYPQIRKGQTAGELLEEFKNPPILTPVIKLDPYGGYTGKGRLLTQEEILKLPFNLKPKPSGFTASPNPLKELKARKGESELWGLYQAPRLSPKFLRILPEGIKKYKLFGLNPFPVLRPTIFRIFPKEYILGAGVTYETTKPVPLATARKFFNPPKVGYSIVAFVKHEKESIIPYDTLFKPLGKEYYIVFRNRRVPIMDLETVGKRTKKKSKDNLMTLKEVETVGKRTKKKSKDNLMTLEKVETVGKRTKKKSKDNLITLGELMKKYSYNRKDVRQAIFNPLSSSFLPPTYYSKSSSSSRQSIFTPLSSSFLFPTYYSKSSSSSRQSIFTPLSSSFLFPTYYSKPLSSSYSKQSTPSYSKQSTPSYSKPLPDRYRPYNPYDPNRYRPYNPYDPNRYHPFDPYDPNRYRPFDPDSYHFPIKTTKLISKIKKFQIKKLTMVRGYRPFVIKKGKKVYLNALLPRGLALRKGENVALKTLRATFGVEPTNILLKRKDIYFSPRIDIFRSYRIKKGKKIPLKDTFIQKLGKRLVSYPERSEIQFLRRIKI